MTWLMLGIIYKIIRVDPNSVPKGVSNLTTVFDTKLSSVTSQRGY